MNKPISVANYFVNKSMSDGSELTPMKLVKMVYIAHGWYLGINEKPLLNESIEAWKYGPVVPSIYHNFKQYNNFQITALGFELGSFNNSCPIVDNVETATFLDKIWEVYRQYSGLQLSTLTHQTDTPWDIIWNKRNGKNYKSASIPNNVIQDYYKKKIAGEASFA